MSKDLSQFPTVPYVGSLSAFPVRLLNAQPGEKPLAVTCIINWGDYNASTANSKVGVSINLEAQAVNTPLPAIRFVEIDNTYSSVSIYVYFPDTRSTVTCPPGGIVGAPVFTGVVRCTVYGEGFYDNDIPQTVVILSNAEKAGYYIPSGLSNRNTVNGIYLDNKSGSNTTRGDSTGGASTFSAMNFGAEFPDRVLIAVVGLSLNSAFTSCDAFTIGGQPATVRQALAISQGSGKNSAVIIADCLLPSGASGAVYVSYTAANGPHSSSCSLYEISNYANVTPIFAGNSATGSLILPMVNGGFAALGQMGNGSLTWVNAISDYAGNIYSGYYFSSAHVKATQNAGLSVTVNGSAVAGVLYH